MSEVVVDTKTESNERSAKLRKIIVPLGLVFALLVVLSIGGFLYYQQAEQDKKEASKPKTLQSSYAAVTKELETKLSKAKTAEAKSNVYVEMSNAEQLIGHEQQAIELAQKAIDAKASVAAYVALGLAAMQSGDKAKAAEAYGKAAELTRAAGGPQAELNAKSYEMMRAEMLQ